MKRGYFYLGTMLIVLIILNDRFDGLPFEGVMTLGVIALILVYLGNLQDKVRDCQRRIEALEQQLANETFKEKEDNQENS